MNTHIETGKQPVFDFSIPRDYIIAGKLKSLGNGKIGGYLVSYGSPTQRDAQNEFFTPKTDFKLDWYERRPVLYHHGFGAAGVSTIGYITAITPDAKGLWAEAELFVDDTDPDVRQWARKAYTQTQKGKLFWSSGSAPHLARITDDGEITLWAIVEGSLTPTPAERSGRTSATVRADLAAIRAATKSLLDSSAEDPEPIEPRAEVLSNSAAVTIAYERGLYIMNPSAVKMNTNQLMAALDEVSGIDDATKLDILRKLSALEAGETPGESPADTTMADEPVDPDAGVGATPDEAMRGKSKRKPAPDADEDDDEDEPVDTDAIANQLYKKLKADEDKKKSAPAKRLPGSTATPPNLPNVRGNPRIEIKTQYDGLSADDMAFWLDFRNKLRQRRGEAPFQDPKYYREMHAKAAKAYEAGDLWLEKDRAKAFFAIKANELDNTQVAAAAGDFVPELWTNQIWRRMRTDARVAGLFPQIEMPSASYKIPLESTDATVYFVAETTDDDSLQLTDNSTTAIPGSKVGADNTTITAKKLALRVGFSTELEEDAIIPLISEFQRQNMEAMMHAIDSLFLNGDTDTAGSTNINAYDGAVTAKSVYLALNGLRKLPLITNTAVAVNMNGSAPTLQQIRRLRFKLLSTLNRYATRTQDLVYIVDEETYGTMLNIDELNVFFNNGKFATVVTGQVGEIDGIPVVASQDLALSAANGKISVANTALNQYGQLLIAVRPAWYVGYRRAVRSWVKFLEEYDSYQMGVTVRVGFINKDTIASAELYGIGVGN